MAEAFALRSRRVVLRRRLRQATIVVRNGKVAEVLPWNESPAGVEVEDFGDLVLMPGLVDLHVHMNEPGNADWEGAETATRAAAAGGVTSVVDMPLNSIPVTTTVAALNAKREAVRGKCFVDVGFHGGLIEGNASELEGLIDEGVLGIKAFLCDSGLPEFPHAREADIRPALRILRQRRVPLLVHAELVNGPRHEWKDPRNAKEWFASRPVALEIEAVKFLAKLWREEDEQHEEFSTPLHIVHISSPRVVEAILDSFPQLATVSLETCPHYLFFTQEQVKAGDTRFKCAPPLRTRKESADLWKMLQERPFNWCVASDHSPCPPGLKHLDTGDFSKAWGGISSMQLGLSIMNTLAHERGSMDLAAISFMMSERPAAIAGINARKGSIKRGQDADLIVFDPDEDWTVEGTKLEHRHKVTPYEGARLRGRIKRTWLRGVEVFRDGVFPSPPHGEFLRRQRP